MTMIFDYVNLLFELFVIISVPILSHKDNYCTFILSSCIFIVGGGDGNIYLYIYNIYIQRYNLLVIRIDFSLSVLYIGCHPIFEG